MIELVHLPKFFKKYLLGLPRLPKKFGVSGSHRGVGPQIPIFLGSPGSPNKHFLKNLEVKVIRPKSRNTKITLKTYMSIMKGIRG